MHILTGSLTAALRTDCAEKVVEASERIWAGDDMVRTTVTVVDAVTHGARDENICCGLKKKERSQG